MLGLHPCSVDKDYSNQLSAIEALLEKNEVVAIGEIGLDYYWSQDFIKEQKDAFQRQILWAQKSHLPIVIHSRDSLDDCIDIVHAMKVDGFTGIFHCFTGTIAQAANILDLEFYCGLGGVTTFKNAKLDDVIKYIPLKKIVLETDAPYLAPHPYRGKRNEPSYVPIIAKKIAEVKGISIEEVASVTTENALTVYQQLHQEEY
jgi:TatD DNase family protein